MKLIKIFTPLLLTILIIWGCKDKDKGDYDLVVGTWTVSKYNESLPLERYTIIITNSSDVLTGEISDCYSCLAYPVSQHVADIKFNAKKQLTLDYESKSGNIRVNADLIDSDKKLDGVWNDNGGNSEVWEAVKQ